MVAKAIFIKNLAITDAKIILATRKPKNERQTNIESLTGVRFSNQESFIHQ